MSTIASIIQLLSVSTALVGAGGIATLSAFDIPILQAQPASRSLPSTRWLFSRGSHVFPTAAFLSSAGFAYLSYAALPPNAAPLLRALSFSKLGGRTIGYAAAAALSISIAPFTSIVMIPTNFELIKLNNGKGGARSEKSAREQAGGDAMGRSAEASTNGEGEAPQFTDLSKPQERTKEDTTTAEDEEVKRLLAKFASLNTTRAILLGAGGVVGLWTALVL